MSKTDRTGALWLPLALQFAVLVANQLNKPVENVLEVAKTYEPVSTTGDPEQLPDLSDPNLILGDSLFRRQRKYDLPFGNLPPVPELALLKARLSTGLPVYEPIFETTATPQPGTELTAECVLNFYPTFCLDEESAIETGKAFEPYLSRIFGTTFTGRVLDISKNAVIYPIQKELGGLVSVLLFLTAGPAYDLADQQSAIAWAAEKIHRNPLVELGGAISSSKQFIAPAGGKA